MKLLSNLLSVVALLVVATSCSSDFIDKSTPDERKELMRELNSKRSVEEAISIASKYGRLKSSQTRGLELIVDETSITPIGGNSTRSDSDTLIYAVNFSDDKGYLLISANRATEPILAIVEDGSFSGSLDQSPESFSYFLENAVKYVENSKILPVPEPVLPGDGPVDFRMVWYDDTIKSVELSNPRIQVNWGKWWPENAYCPNKYPGCGPIAIAQAMTYFKPKIDCELTFEGRPFDRLSVDWIKMLTHKQSTDIRYPETEETNDHISHCNQNYGVHQNIGALLRQIGVWCASTYNENSTSTDVDRFFDICDRYFPSKDKIYVSGGNCYEKLKSTTGIAIVSGFCKEGGHGWIMDGIGTIEYMITRYHCYSPKTHEYEEKEIIYQTKKYVHCNWGWAGKDNGYFLEGVYDTHTGLGTIEHEEDRYNFNMGVSGYIYVP